MINLYLNEYAVEDMVAQAGDVVIRRPIKAKVTMERNKEWSVEIEFPEADMLGYQMVNEAYVKVDLTHANDQLFSVVYWKYNRKKRTYTVYGIDIFHLSQKEVLVTDSEFTQVSTWAKAIETLNELITKANPKKNYILEGAQGYDNTAKPDRFHSYLIIPHYDQTKAIDVYQQNMNPGARIVSHPMNRTLAQRYYMTPDSDGDWFQLWNEKSIMPLDILGEVIAEERQVTQSEDHSGNNQRWKIEQSPYPGYWNIVSKLDPRYCLAFTAEEHYYPDVAGGTIPYRQLCISQRRVLPSAAASRQSFQFHRSETVTLAHWEQLNLIEILFGTSDYSMVSKWEECEQAHVTAIYNNLTCYFGGDYSESWCKPVEYYISSPRLVTSQEKTVDMEEVYTGIVPIGANDRMLPTDYPGTVNGVVTLGDTDYFENLYEKYQFHRVKYMEYPEIIWTEDQADASLSEYDVYSSPAHLNRALMNRAKKDLRKTSIRKPTVDLDIKIAYILDNEELTSKLKLSDRIYFTGNVSDTVEGFYLDKIEYDLITKRITDVTLAEIKEDI